LRFRIAMRQRARAHFGFQPFGSCMSMELAMVFALSCL
jgi:hypothetical protein